MWHQDENKYIYSDPTDQYLNNGGGKGKEEEEVTMNKRTRKPAN